MRVAVTGAGGFVGQAIVLALLRRGDFVVALGRHPDGIPAPGDVVRRRFDPNDAEPQPQVFEDVDAVIHLAGESVAGRWTESKKRTIRDSRIDGTRHLVESLAACKKRPAALISASAVGYYGSRGDEPLFESSLPGTDFLASVCVGWESAASEAESLGIRTACLRTGIVLGEGGALASMSAPFKLGLGGPFGSGRQFMPWIHIDDLVALYLFVLDGDLRGAINAVSADYATSARFSQALGSALQRPALIPAPDVALRVALGEFASTVLASQLVIPARAEDAGFAWHHALLEEAMAQALRSRSSWPHGVSTFESTQTVKASADRVFAFFSSPQNLEHLTPTTLHFAFTSCPETIGRGSRISYRLRLHGVPMTWDTLIARWQPPERFVDVQLHGPYALWQHEHIFQRVAAGVILIDRVQYVLPFAPFGKLATPLVKRDVEQIFAFRRRAIEAQFSK